MNKTKKLSPRNLARLAFAAVVLFTPVVRAATITTAMNDLILGFRATGAPGQTLNLEVDLGNMSNFYGVASGSTVALPSLSVQDLSNVFGASWFTRTDLFWGAITTTGRGAGTPDGHAPVGTLWATAPATAPAWNRGNVFAQKNASAAIEAMLVPGALGTLDGATSTTNSPTTAILDATISGSWTYQDFKTVGTSFGYFNPTIDSPATVPNGGQVVAQLYELQPSGTSGQPGTLLGNLVLTRTGLSFHAAGGSAAPAIGVSGTLTFGNVTTGATAAATLTITNSGSATLTVTNITYPTGFSGAFSGPIAAGSATNVTVTFAPVAVTTYSGTVTVNSSATSGTGTISASGTGTAVATRVIGLSGSLAFGNITTGATANATLTIANTGNSVLTVSSISYPSGFSGAFAGTIPAGGSHDVAVTFAPVAVLSYSGTVTVNSDATSGTGTLTASGAGIPAVVPVTKIIGVSGSLAFGSVITGTTATATLTINNNGNTNLTVTSISYPTGFSGAFAGSIPAGDSQNVAVTFTPIAAASYGGTLTVHSDATAGTSTLAMSGTGSLPPVNHPPTITTGPSITNALAVINGNFVVAAGETNDFLVGATDPDGNPVMYQWIFGDNVTNAAAATALAAHAYPVGACGSYPASVAVSDGHWVVTSNLTVIAACQLTITKMQIGVNFAKVGGDTISVAGKLNLPGITTGSQLAGVSAAVAVGAVQVPFTLDNKGRGIGANGTCVLVYTKATKKLPGFWTATVTLSKGNWHPQLATSGLTNATIKKPGQTVTLPVVLIIGSEAFAAEKPLNYTATLNKTGTAK